MATAMELDDVASADATSVEVQPLALRSYQVEMVEESLNQNIIVVMDTGSGKTHMSRAELEICKPSKRIWFLAPTVTLCEQQSQVFSQHLPAYKVLVLSGQDDVDHWTDQAVWDLVLQNVRIVLSTHQVLYDALAHAFVKMDDLALLIFDEAHHCTLNHPANRIMSNFYAPRARSGDARLPKVLGLSASPVMKAGATTGSLEQIERNLNATTKTPKKSRLELARYVHQPELIRIDYRVEERQSSALIIALDRSYREYDLMQDPYTRDLLRQQQNGGDVSAKLQKLFTSQKTYCTEQLRTLTVKAQDMISELGPSAVDWYLHQCVAKFEKTVCDAEQLLDWSNDERHHLLAILKKLPLQSSDRPLDIDDISQKVERLIDVLANEAQNKSKFSGLVFVEQRAWLAVLAEILRLHPRTKDLLRTGTFLGTSSSSKRKQMIASLPEIKNQKATLDDFRAGMTNLILTTSVLEEGIDVSICHLVVCFERPKNLKSFVQRRGRARMQESKYFIFMPDAGGGRDPESWEALEEEMKAAYLNDLRQGNLAKENEKKEEAGSRTYEVDATGARLTLDDALPHLTHFCSILGSGPYVDPRPQFKLVETDYGIAAEVTLPISVDRAVRKTRSSESWRTEKMAIKDAAFEAYKALHLAGLVSDNLLPLRQESDTVLGSHVTDDRPSLVLSSPTLDPWRFVAQEWQRGPREYFQTLIEFHTSGQRSLYVRLLTVTPMPALDDFHLYWNGSRAYTIRTASKSTLSLTAADLITLQSATRRILLSVYESRMQEERHDFLWLLAPCDQFGNLLNSTKLARWEQATSGSQSAMTLLGRALRFPADWGIISQEGDNRRYILHTNGNTQQGCQPSKTCLQVVRVPKRRDFLHPIVKGNGANDAYTRIDTLEASSCRIDNLPASYAVIALLLPSILHKLEVVMVADSLRTTLLSPAEVEPEDLPLIVTALTASSADDEDNYQRLEYLGDCILKFVSSLHVMAENPTWPANYLTVKKGQIVSNGFLSRGTLQAGLDKFIISKRFTGAKWSPRYWADVLAATAQPEKTEKSSKLLADIVESLIGVGYVRGGLPKAFLCIQTLLPLEQWSPIPAANDVLYEAAPADISVTHFDVLEPLVGYTFDKRMLLLEALTHASYIGPNVNCSYDRLEFLGDAVLDYIITTRLYEHNPPLSHPQMHSIQAAMVNAAFLAFTMFETTVAEETISKSTMRPEIHRRALWQYLRSGSPQITVIRNEALRQHAEMREQLIHALRHDAEFPWHLLSLINAPKLLSDIVESVIGAIYVDSHGDLSACETFIQRLGILDYLERILHDNVDCLHPKERLGHLAIDRTVEYIHVPLRGERKSSDLTPSMGVGWRCRVKVGGEEIGGVVEGFTRLCAETIAAWRANEILRGQRFGAAESSGDEVFFDADDEGGIALGD